MSNFRYRKRKNFESDSSIHSNAKRGELHTNNIKDFSKPRRVANPLLQALGNQGVLRLLQSGQTEDGRQRESDRGSHPLAINMNGNTWFSPEIVAHLKRHEIEGHEAVHRAQFTAFGNRPPGTREQLEADRASLPSHLRVGLESISGMDLSGVRVHYNSTKPTQVKASAYTHCQDIHLSPGQEKHLPHEGWHGASRIDRRLTVLRA